MINVNYKIQEQYDKEVDVIKLKYQWSDFGQQKKNRVKRLIREELSYLIRKLGDGGKIPLYYKDASNLLKDIIEEQHYLKYKISNELRLLQGGCCAYCGLSEDEFEEWKESCDCERDSCGFLKSFAIDHINSIKDRSGNKDWSIDNLVLSCPPCNLAKNSFPFQLFLKYLLRIARNNFLDFNNKIIDKLSNDDALEYFELQKKMI